MASLTEPLSKVRASARKSKLYRGVDGRSRAGRKGAARKRRSCSLAVESLEARIVFSLGAGPDAEGCGELGADVVHVLPPPETGDVAFSGDSTSGSGGESAGAVPLAETFLLHSRPGANQTIFLDFDGHVTSGTSWNTNYNDGLDIVTPAYDFDGDVTSFSDAELERIQRIWQRVTEDFSPFDVDVTTEDPGVDALLKSGAGDTQWGIRIVIGGSSYDWWGSGAGGVAYTGSFSSSLGRPAFVFEEQLGNGNEKYTAEAISHETGHTLGLSHDGRTTPYNEEYYGGNGAGVTGWAPIMGVSYYKELTQFSKGEYAYANNTQDDLTIITTNNGFGYRPDDAGDSPATAASLTVAGTSVSGSGLIERTADVDLFRFATGAGVISLVVQPFERGPNLDIVARLLDASNNVIATSNPIDSLGAAINMTVPAGLYYLSIDGGGFGDPLLVGYTDYATLGSYTIGGTLVSTTEQFVSIAATDAARAEGNSGSTSFTFTVTRVGDVSGVTSIDYVVQGSGANPAAAQDFAGGVFAAGTVNFTAGETTQIITVLVNGDTQVELDEEFTASLSVTAGVAQLVVPAASGTILNDDSPTPAQLSIAATDATRDEGNAGSTPFTFTVTRTGGGQATSVNYTVTGKGNFPASAGDFVGNVLPSGTVSFAAGENSKTVVIYVAGDTANEKNEGFAVTLSNPGPDTTIATAAASGTIVNDDKSTGGPPRGEVLQSSVVQAALVQAIGPASTFFVPAAKEARSADSLHATESLAPPASELAMNPAKMDLSGSPMMGYDEPGFAEDLSTTISAARVPTLRTRLPVSQTSLWSDLVDAVFQSLVGA